MYRYLRGGCLLSCFIVFSLVHIKMANDMLVAGDKISKLSVRLGWLGAILGVLSLLLGIISIL